MVFARRRLALYTLGALLLCLVFRPMQYLGPMLRGSCGEAAHMVIVVPGGGLEGDGDIPPHTKVYGIMWHHVTALRRSCAGYTRGVGARAAPSYIRTSYVHTSTTPPPHLHHTSNTSTPPHTHPSCVRRKRTKYCSNAVLRARVSLPPFLPVPPISRLPRTCAAFPSPR